MEDTIFIEVLKYGAGKGLEGVSFEELKRWIYDRRDAGFSETEHVLLNNLFDECFERAKTGYDTDKLNLKTEYYFRLIEYQELQESRKASREANRNAFIAIGISLLAILASAILTFTQLNTPTRINKSDLTALIESNRDAGIQKEVKLDSLQMAQILSAIGYGQSNPKSTTIPKATDQGGEISIHGLINQYFEEE